MHAIQTAKAANDTQDDDTRLPSTGHPSGEWLNPVLTVSDRHGRQVSLMVTASIGTFDSAAAVVVNPWGQGEGPAVRIEGEDLFALRELMAELPESAFVRPADPVEVVSEHHGTILIDGDDEVWVFNGYVDRWFLTGPFSRLEEYTGADIDWHLARRATTYSDGRTGLDEGAEKIFAEYGGAIAAPLPRWSNGDLMRNGHTGNLYFRERGQWRILNARDDFAAAMRFTDDEISAAVDSEDTNGNVVLVQKNA